MKSRTVLFLLLVFTFPLCFSCSDDNDDDGLPEYLSEIVDKYDLELEDGGVPKTRETVTLPEQLTDAQWGITAATCGDGCYDLYSHAGETVVLTQYGITEIWDGEPLNLLVITKDNECVCAYKILREGKDYAPGIFALSGDCS